MSSSLAVPMTQPGGHAAAEPSYSVSGWNVDEAYELGRKSRCWDVACEQLSAGKFHGEVTEVWLRSIQIVREVSNQSFLEYGESWKDSYTFAVFSSEEGSGRYFGAPVGPDDICMLSSDAEIDTRTPPYLERTSVTIGSQVLDPYLSPAERMMLNLNAPVGLLRTNRGFTARLRQCLTCIIDTVGAAPELLQHPQTRKTLEESVVSAIFESVIHSRTDCSRERLATARESSIIKAARDYIFSHPDEPVTVLDLCSHMNISRRTLQYSFENRLGIKPSMYLRVLRLNAAHRELKLGDSATGNVTEVATHWGFWHLARFSMYYRDLFGEYPSETLNHQRRHS